MAQSGELSEPAHAGCTPLQGGKDIQHAMQSIMATKHGAVSAAAFKATWLTVILQLTTTDQ